MPCNRSNSHSPTSSKVSFILHWISCQICAKRISGAATYIHR
jgi:hypothetical protein